MNTPSEPIRLKRDSDPSQTPRRIAMVPQHVPVRFLEERTTEPLVMSAPHLLIRIMIAFMLTVIAIALMGIFFDAPLEELANPQNTPNPAKAPWYFLGLQELLHFFPPVVAGIVIPGLVVLALVVIPYFNVNVEPQPLWESQPRKKFVYLTGSVVLISLLSGVYRAWGIFVPTLLLYVLMLVPIVSKRRSAWIGFVRRRSLGDWIMTWFVALSTVLTIIGTLFRGPGWGWVWPWQAGG